MLKHQRIQLGYKCDINPRVPYIPLMFDICPVTWLTPLDLNKQ